MIPVDQTFKHFSHWLYNVFDKSYTFISSHPYTSLSVGAILFLGLSYKYGNPSVSYERRTQLNHKNLGQKSSNSISVIDQREASDVAHVGTPSTFSKGLEKKNFWNTKRTFEVEDDSEDKIDLSKYFTIDEHQNDPIMLGTGFKSARLRILIERDEYISMPILKAINKIKLATKKRWKKGRRCLVTDCARIKFSSLPNDIVRYKTYEDCLKFFTVFPTYAMLSTRFMSVPPMHIDPCLLSLCHRSAINCFYIATPSMRGKNVTNATFLDSKIHQQSLPKAPNYNTYWCWDGRVYKGFKSLRRFTPEEVEQFAKIILLGGKSYLAKNSENYKRKLKRIILITQCIDKDSHLLVSGWGRKNISKLLPNDIISLITYYLPLPRSEVKRIESLYKSPRICESRIQQYVLLLASLVTTTTNNLYTDEVDQVIREIKRIIDIIIENKIALIESKIKSDELRASGENLKMLLIYLFYQKAKLRKGIEPYMLKGARNKLFLEFKEEFIDNNAFHTEVDSINLLNRILHFVNLGGLQLGYSGCIVGERGQDVFIPFKQKI